MFDALDDPQLHRVMNITGYSIAAITLLLLVVNKLFRERPSPKTFAYYLGVLVRSLFQTVLILTAGYLVLLILVLLLVAILFSV